MENKEIYESPFIEIMMILPCETLRYSREDEYDDDEDMGDWDSQGW